MILKIKMKVPNYAIMNANNFRQIYQSTHKTIEQEGKTYKNIYLDK